MLLLACIPFRDQLSQQMMRFYSGILCGHFSRLLWQSPRYLTHIFSARCRLLFQRMISLLESICALSCRRIGRENCWWYNFLPPDEAKPLQSSGHLFNRLPAKGRALLLYCSQQKANLFWKSLSISRIGVRKLKEVMVLGRNLSKCAFHRIRQACLPVTWYPRKNVFVIVVFSIVLLNQFPLVSPFVRAFLSLESHFHWDPCGSRFLWHLGNHTSTTWAGWKNFYNIRRERFQNVDAITKQCMFLLSYIDYPKCSYWPLSDITS